MNFVLALVLTTAFAQSKEQAKEIPFKDKVHITFENYTIDNASNEQALNCQAYHDLSSQGLKANLKTAAGISYALECKAGEIGSNINLLVFKNKKQISSLNEIASKGGDCGYSFETQSWLVDLNGDKMMDVLTRLKSKTVPSDCGEGAKPKAERDEVMVYFWNAEKLTHEKANLDDKDLKRFRKKYDF